MVLMFDVRSIDFAIWRRDQQLFWGVGMVIADYLR